MRRINGEVWNLRKRNVSFRESTFILNIEWYLSRLFTVAIAKFEHLLASLDLGANCISLQLENHGLIFFDTKHHAVFMECLWFEVCVVLHMINSILLFWRGQCEVFCEYSVFETNSCLANDSHLMFFEWFNLSYFRLEKHDSLTLLGSDFRRCLNHGKFFHCT